MGEATGNGRFDVAMRRLDRALTMLSQRLAHRLAEADAEAGGLFELDRSQLAAALDASRARERQLEEAGAQASAALERAMAEIRALAAEEG